MIDIVRSSSILMMLINSIQASFLPLFINFRLPPNLYSILKIFSILTIGNTPSWNQTMIDTPVIKYARFNRLEF